MKYLYINICKHNYLITIKADEHDQMKYYGGFTINKAIKDYRLKNNLKYKHYEKIITYTY